MVCPPSRCPPQVGQKRAREPDGAEALEENAPRKKVRLGLPATQWITVYNAHKPMKQRYHYNGEQQCILFYHRDWEWV